MPPIHGDPQSKPTSNLLSLFLKPIIMLLLTSLFFVFIGFAAFLLLNLFLLGGALHRLRFRPNHNLNNLPRFRVSRGSELAPESRCVVCLDGFRNGQWCRKLPGCGHLFHRRCVDMWLVKVAACPTCRTPIRFNAEVNVATQDDWKFFLLIVKRGGRRWLARVKGTVAMHGSQFCFRWWTMALIDSGRGQGAKEESEPVFVMNHEWYAARSELFQVAPQRWWDPERIQ